MRASVDRVRAFLARVRFAARPAPAQGRPAWAPWSRRRKIVVIVLTGCVIGTPGWFWWDSLVPATYSVMDLGYADYGGGPADVGHDHGGVSVADLTGATSGTPDVEVTLTARREEFALATGERVNGYTLNRVSPGPTIRAAQGDLVEVALVNESVPDGVTLHWHGVDVPNAADGVAGVTQDAVPTGGRHVYRFRADNAGTYWYHSHQKSREQVAGGLFGVLVIDPRTSAATTAAAATMAATAVTGEVIAAVHTYAGLGTISGRTGRHRVPAPAGSSVRLRVVNTENASIVVAVHGAPYRLVAVDGRDVTGPSEVRDRTVVVAGGGRADLTFVVPDGSAVRVEFGTGTAGLAIGPDTAPLAPVRALEGTLDLLSYGSPAPIGFDPHRPDRRFEYRVDRRLAFVDGRPGSWWTVNGHLFPDLPMFLVREGDVVVMTIKNSFGSLHPMHLHGHHAVVVERNGVRATGSPWWTDTLDVEKGATYVIAFIADNPGIWLDHCHNLTHADAGLVAHLAYIGVTEPFQLGGPAGNHPG